MPTLAAPAPRFAPPRIAPPAAAPARGLELASISFFGRTLAEYAAFFALDPAALRGRDVLDVGAGPSSFTAEACARRIDAVALDPLYGTAPHDLAAKIDADYAHMFAQIRAKRSLIKVGHTFESLDAAEADRRLAAQRFLADYETHFAHGRYVGGSLPLLPFFDGTFDLVLCAHLLFVYGQRFDFDWHLAACRELVRVTANEVRLHPLCGVDGRPYPKLAALRRELKAGGIASEVRSVDYAFFAGADSMLVLRRAAE